MNFFNDLGKKTTECTNKITREAKLRMIITENKGKIKDLYEEMGRKIYENHVREENIDINELIREDYLNLDKLSNEIEDARKEILELNHKKLCSKCFSEIDIDFKFCPECGEKQTGEKTTLEKAEERLENEEISKNNKNESEIVKEELKQKNNNN